MTDYATTEDILKIIQSATERRDYILWLAEMLEQSPNPLIREEAAKVLRWLVS